MGDGRVVAAAAGAFLKGKSAAFDLILVAVRLEKKSFTLLLPLLLEASWTRRRRTRRRSVDGRTSLGEGMVVLWWLVI